MNHLHKIQISKPKQDIYFTSIFHKKAIFQSKQQIKKGLVIENNKVEKEIDKLLKTNNKKNK